MALASVGGNSVVTGVERQVVQAPEDPEPFQNAVDPGHWQTEPWRYTVAITGTKRALALGQSSFETGPVDGMVFSGATLYALKGQSAVLPAVPAVPLSRTGVEVEHVSYTGVALTATSHSGAWSAYTAATGAGSARRVYRVRPDGAVEDLGPTPFTGDGNRLAISDLGQVMIIANRRMGVSTCECDKAAVVYWFTEEWFGPAPVGRSTFGAVTSSEDAQPGLPQVHMASADTGKEYVSADYGITWVELSGSGGWIASSVPEIAAYSAPYQYYLAGVTSSGARVVRRHVTTGAVNSVYLPVGLTVAKILVGPNDPSSIYVVSTASTGAVSVHKLLSNMTWQTVLSGVTPPSTGLEYSFGPDGRLYARKTSVCTTAAFVNQWSISLTGTSFADPSTLWWGPVPAPAAGGAGKVLVPARPNGAIDEWQIAIASVSNTLVAPANLAATQSGFGVGGYGAAADGSNLTMGNFTQQATDLSIVTAGRPLSLTRTFNGLNPRIGLFGQGWTTSYEMKSVVNCGTSAVTIVFPDGRTELYTPNGSGGFVAPVGSTDTLTLVSGFYRLVQRDGTMFEFIASNGRLNKVVDAAGRAQQLAYNGSGRLSTVTDVVTARSLTFVYSGSLVTEVLTNPVTSNGLTAQIVVRFGYVGNLLERACAASDPDLVSGDCTLYTMASGRLTAVIDANGHTDVAVGYDGSGRPVWQEDGEGGRVTITYETPVRTVHQDASGVATIVVSDQEHRQHQVIDEAGNARTYTYDTKGYPVVTELASGQTTTATYDPNGNILTREDGVGTSFMTYDAWDNPTSIADPRSSGASDTTYQTTMTWDGPRHLLLTKSLPATAGVPVSVAVKTYTTGSEAAVGGGLMPAYLLRTDVSPTGETTTYSYDSKGNLRRLVDPGGLITEYTVDELGRVVSVTEKSDSFPLGVTRSFEYDAAGRLVKELGASVVNPVTGVTHRQMTEQTFDPAGNLVMITSSDVGGAAVPDAPRQVIYTYDGADRRTSETVVGIGTTHLEYDDAGRVVAVEDQLGRRTITTYNEMGLPTSETIKANAASGLAADLVVWTKTYDADGHVATTTDSLGRTRRYSYDAAGRTLSETLEDFDDGTVVRDVVLSEATYDAAGNVVQRESGNGLRVEVFTYDAAGRLLTSTMDPSGVNRTTTYTYDAAGRSITATLSDGTLSEQTSYSYDTAGRLASTTRENGAVDFVTTYTYDDRGLQTEVVGPEGNLVGAVPADFATTATYDALGRPWSVLSPPVLIHAEGATPSVERPEVVKGYDTYGDATHEVDARGNTTTRVFDQVGRAVAVHYPAYLTPLGVTLLPVETVDYDAAGNVVSRTDTRGYTTHYDVDFANRVVTIEAATSSVGTPTSHVEYDVVGRQTAAVGADGARKEFAYDDLDRVRTATDIVRNGTATADSHVWEFSYDDLGNRTQAVSPEGRTTSQTFNAASEVTTATDGAGKVTTFDHDVAGRTTAVTDPLGRSTVTFYDMAGRPVQVDRLDAANTELSTELRDYDAAGRLVHTVSPQGVATTIAGDHEIEYTYNPGGWLAGVSQLAGPGQVVESGYRYDANGNLTGVVNGNGAITYMLYNAWNLPTSTVEPATSQHPTLSDRTWTTTYDAGGLAVAVQEPGGFSRTLTYDPYGALLNEEGTNGTTTVSRDRLYDIAGRLEQVNSPVGDLELGYDDRGLLISATGGSSAIAVQYDADGLPTTRIDAAGTSAFAWDARGLLGTIADPVSGESLAYSYDDAGRVSTVQAASGTTYAYAWDDLGRLSEESVGTVASGTTAARTYSYDLNGNVLEQEIIAAGNPQAGVHTYAYDWSERLTEWDSPSAAPVTYGWDDAGNRTSVDSVSFTFDERNRLVSSSAGLANTFNARGDLVQTGTTSYGFDPLGRLTSAAGRSLSYDGLDRVVSLDGESVTYAGAASDPTAVGDWVFGRGPGGAVLSADDGTNASLVFPDRHGDASLMVDPATAAIDASQVFDPFGQVAGTTGASSPLGFQSDVTDAVTGDVWMGARWMSPSLGVFTSRDTYAGAVATPATLNRYSYANGNPMSNWDPTGHSSEAVSPGEPGHEVADAQRELKERTAKGDVGVAQGRPLLGGPMELITAFKAPKTGGWDFVKSIITFAVTAIAGVACGPIAGGLCASMAGRFTSALLDGASASELFDVVTDWKSLLRDGLIGLVSLGAGAAMGTLFSGAANTVGRFVGTVVGGVVAGGATDFAATLMQGGSVSQAWDAATNLRARAIDAGISTAMAIHQARGGRSSSKAGDEDGQAGNRPAKPDGPEADVTPAGHPAPSVEIAATGVGGSETFYRGMSNTEYEGLAKTGRLSPRGESFVTQDLGYVQQLAARHPGDYERIVEFEMQPGTRQALADRGARDQVLSQTIEDAGLGGLPAIQKGDPSVVHIKGERGAVNFGLKTGSADVFNCRILGFCTISGGQ